MGKLQYGKQCLNAFPCKDVQAAENELLLLDEKSRNVANQVYFNFLGPRKGFLDPNATCSIQWKSTLTSSTGKGHNSTKWKMEICIFHARPNKPRWRKSVKIKMCLNGNI